MEAKQSIIINRPIEEVFDVATCHERCVVWRGPIADAKKTSDGPAGVGTSYHHTLTFLGQSVAAEPVITVWDPPYRAEFENHKGPATYKSEFVCEPVEQGTKLTTGIQLEISGIFRHIPDVLVRQAAMRQHKSDLQALKDLLENGIEIKV